MSGSGSTGRRQFLHGALAASAGLLLSRGSSGAFAQAPSGTTARAAEARLDILLDEPIGRISSDLYGHFVEHLGGVVYDGIWVGEQSKIPNIGGIRKALVDKLKPLKPGVIRWPGGCFADSYDWRDGIGPPANRPRRTDFWVDTASTRGAKPELRTGPQDFDPNRFGLHEFMALCRETGAAPYLAANLRSATAKDFYQWVEYCNAPAGLTTLSDQRAANGSREPFDVRYWGVGNESWGCGGNFTPEEYATEYRRFIAWVPRYGKQLSYIAAGPSSDDVAWTTKFFTKLTERDKGLLNRVYGWGLHHYSASGGLGSENSIDFTTDQWYKLLASADQMESLITTHWAAMGAIDTTHKVKLAVDEWGAWHARAADMPASYLWAYPGALRDALVSGLTLDTFNRHADKVVMGNVAQLVNTIHSLFLAHEDKFIVTPNYHVFEMYSAHYNGTSLRTVSVAPRFELPKPAPSSSGGGAAAAGAGAASGAVDAKPQTLWSLNGSASLHDKTLIVTVVNPHATQPRVCEIAPRGARVKSGRARVLTSSDLKAHNSFTNPDALSPRDADVAVGTGPGPLVYTFAPASVTRLTLELA
jgi:alpha-L-arabinofuranosidase